LRSWQKVVMKVQNTVDGFLSDGFTSCEFKKHSLTIDCL
jgi:hypothetical protein